MVDNVPAPVAPVSETPTAPVVTPSAPAPVASTPVTFLAEAPKPSAVADAPKVAPVAPVVAPALAPVAVAAETPVVEAPKAPAETPKVEPAPVAEAPKPVEAVAEQPKPAEGDKTNTDGGQTEKAPPPSYEPFKLPENITLEAEKVGKFTEILSELETGGKVPHELVQQFGQKAVDMYVAAVTKNVQDYNKSLEDAWSKQKNDWKEAFLKDPDMGGNRWKATIDAANEFIATHGGTPEQQTEFRNLMETSGLGNHPAMIRIIASAGRAMQEGRPLAAPKPAPSGSKSKTQTLYGKTFS